MTAEQLVHLITDNFAADEEVTFLYHDEYGDWRSTDAEVSKHTQTTVNGHWEMKQIDLAYLEGADREGYLHDMDIAQKWADLNRTTIAARICEKMGWLGLIDDSWTTEHNYIASDNIIRKSSISAKKGERVLIPLNMRDGSIIGIGKGNEDWNESAPHGAGRLMSRAKARESIDLAAYEKSMEGIFTTSVSRDTIDEAPFAYKPSKKIVEQIADTVDVVEVIKPVYNFKASE